MAHRVIGLDDEKLLQELTDKETIRINEAVAVESEWWKNHVITDESKAIESGILVPIPDEGDMFRLIGRLRGGKEPRLTTPQARNFLRHVLRECKRRVEVDTTNFWFAITSLYRSLDLQQRMVEDNPLASKWFSSHTAGKSIDFDPNGYYFGENRMSVQTDNIDVTFNAVYRDILALVLGEYEEKGLCHMILEKRYRVEGNHIIEYIACIHVCVAPEYK